jgi:uncharacterized protein with FMN-binding domain
MYKTPPQRTSRSTRKPDLMQTLKKFVLSAFVVFSFVAYAIHDRLTGSSSEVLNQNNLVPQPAAGKTTSPKGSGGAAASSVVANQATSTPADIGQPTVNVPTNQPAPTNLPPTNVPAPTATPKGAYRDGQYTGPVTDAFYGNVQVKAVIQGGKLTDVQWLDFPHDRRTSQMINQQATPWLKQEAIQAQSAQVDFISGATLTSQAFVQSLQYALSQAAN